MFILNGDTAILRIHVFFTIVPPVLVYSAFR
jgi:hypothetical protein